ncbi:ribosome small subunit-dependent GTPase A [Chloroflexota bacterium]
MKLEALGFDRWFENKLIESGKTGYHMARVISINKGSYTVRNEDGESLAELAGEFIYSAESYLQYPAVGDWAYVQYYNDNNLAIIHDLLPRKTILRRKTAGKNIDYQLIAANIELAFVIQSCDSNFNIHRLERYLVMISDGQIVPVILLSKSDLVSQGDLDIKILTIKDTGTKCEIITYSVETGAGLPQIHQLLKYGMTYCLLGSSGVGKTTLLNHLTGRSEFRTNTIREKDGKGRHTTSRRQLVVLEQGGMLIDTPGMRELGNIDMDSGIENTFFDILKVSDTCRYKDCTHTKEPDCSVLQAVQSGSINENHYQDYLNLKRESEYYQLSYLEKRRKDRKFGQFIKTAKKQTKNK